MELYCSLITVSVLFFFSGDRSVGGSFQHCCSDETVWERSIGNVRTCFKTCSSSEVGSEKRSHGFVQNIETIGYIFAQINHLFVGYIAAQPQATPQSYNAIDMTFNGYNWTYKFTNDSSLDMVPCQGNCMGPCTSQCSLSQDCCCCDPNMMAQNQMAPAPAYPPVSQGISCSRIRLNGPSMPVQHLVGFVWTRPNV